MELKSFKIARVEEIEHEGKKFTTYKAIAKGGRLMDVRFTRDCKNKPTEKCEILVKPENANVDTTRQYPILWIKDVEEIRPLERKNNTDEYFD